MMTTNELLEMYKSLFDTWRFEVNSHWQRSSYFAAFETVAIAACWKLITDAHTPKWAGIVLSAFGIVLTGIWFLNNNKTRYYARYWLKTVGEIERKLVERSGEQDIDFAAKILKRRRTDLIGHPYLVQAVPSIFFVAWVILLFSGIRSVGIESGSTGHPITYELISFVIAVASLVLSAAAALIAKSSLSQAKQVADRDQMEWRQRKWADMYLKANETYDSLDRFRVLSASWSTEDWEREWNDLMRVIRGAHAAAVVFPKNPAVDSFLSSTAVFKDERTVSEERLSKVFDAVELIRQNGRMPSSILE
jgi:hypothetical protein